MSAARASAVAHQAVLGHACRDCASASSQDAIGLGVRVGEHLVAVLGQPPGGFDLIGNGHSNLIEDVQDLLLVDQRARRQRQARAAAEHLLELIEQVQDVHGLR